MNCPKAERLMLRRHDGRLSPSQGAELDLHLRSCTACRDRGNEYAFLFQALRTGDIPAPRENFCRRVEARISERERENGWAQVRRWCRRAVPAALALTAIILAGILAFSPAHQDEYSPSEALLLQDDNPLSETRTLIEENRVENKNMMLIFASAEDYGLSR